MLFEKQEYQEKCVENILTALKGIDFESPDPVVLKRNLEGMQGPERFPTKEKFRLDVLMETGTGKTFVYLKTIFELNKQLGLNKFVIVVPRLAIKSGILQQIDQTKAYFYAQYGKHLNVIDYRGEASLSDIQHNLVNGDSLTVLLINNSAFNSTNNVMRRRLETLYQYGNTWEAIAACRPVVIIDEPHLLEGEKTVEGLDRLTESLFIRFGATYPTEDAHKLSNVIYTLDSISSFNQLLVKRIGVNTISAEGEESGLRVVKIRKERNEFDLSYSINQVPQHKTVRRGEDIGAKTGLKSYAGISATRIFLKKVTLNDSSVLELQSGNYALSDEEIRYMLRKAIRTHFEKEERLFEQDIKALSLFFIPGINDFRGDSPRVKNIFEEEYRIIRQEFYDATDNTDYKAYLDRDFKENGELRVHNGYFSGEGRNNDEKIADGVDKILNKKEELLSLEEPLRFVFSVWALQEGWDNPNIFTICKLASTTKETARRQQVGRGLRLAVNQQGKRLTIAHFKDDEDSFYRVNELDMIVSGQEADFIYGIQNEIISASFTLVGDTVSHRQLTEKGLSDKMAGDLLRALGQHQIIEYRKDTEDYLIKSDVLDFIKANRQVLLDAEIDDEDYAKIENIFSGNYENIVKNKNRETNMVTVRREGWDRFKDLWEAINRESRLVYKDIDEDALIESIVAEFSGATISQVRIKVTRQTYDAKKNEVRRESVDTLGDAEFFQRQTMAKFLAEFAKSENLPLPFVVRLFARLDTERFKRNPAEARKLLSHLIHEKVHETIIRSVEYKFAETTVYANALQDEDGVLLDRIKPTALGKIPDEENVPRDEYLYDRINYDSRIERESIVGDPMRVDGMNITVFAKLPRIRIPTPYKTYNPDFAYVVEHNGDKKIFLVVETKGHKYESDIPEDEKKKIEYGEKFFTALQERLPGVKVSFKKRIENQGLETILREIIDD